MGELEGLRETLYRQITQLRGDVPRELSPQWQGLPNQRRRLVRIIPAWMVIGFTLACLVAMYLGFAWALDEQRESVLQAYQALDPAVVLLPSQP
jgi:type VI secretion system protein ImpK